jgi:hypothetical protein
LLACPDDDCPEQNAYLQTQRDTMDSYEEQMQAYARRFVREALGLPASAAADIEKAKTREF